MEYIGTCENDTKLDKEKEIVLFGCGKMAHGIYRILQQKHLDERVRYFCDNNEAVQGTSVCGCTVVSVEHAVREYPDAAYIVASTCVREMTEQLRDMGIKKIHIIHT